MPRPRGEGMNMEYRPQMKGVEAKNPEHPTHIEGKEQREFDREVVRVFLLQSRNHKDVYRDIMPELEQGRKLADVAENYDFVQVILMEKGKQSTKNPGQAMPAGGNLNEHETVEMAAAREVHEETHLRPMNIEPIGSMSYTHTYEEKDTKEIKVDTVFAHQYIGSVLPTDTPYPLHPKEDKVYKFPTFTLDEMLEFWSKGKIEKDGREIPLFDNLLTSLVRNKMPEAERLAIPSSLSLKEEGDMWSTMRSLGEKMIESEHEKKWTIMKNIMMYLNFSVNEQEYWHHRMHDFKSGEYIHDKHTNSYREFLKLIERKYPHKVKDAFFASVELSNFEEELVFAGESKLEAVTRFMYTLLELKYPFDIYLEKAKQNPKLHDFANKIDTFIRSLKGIALQTGEKPDSKEYRNAFEIIDEFVTEFEEDLDELEHIIREEFCAAFDGVQKEDDGDGSKDAYARIGGRIERLNTFFGKMSEEIKTLANAAGSTVEAIVLMNEVEGAGLVSLIQFSIPTERAKAYFEEIDPTTKTHRFSKKSQRELVFEARRSLALLAMFGEFDTYFQTVKALGKEPIERVWGGVFSAPNDQIHLVKKMGDIGMEAYTESREVLPSQESYTGPDAAYEDLAEQKIAVDKSNPRLRRFVSEDGFSYLVSVTPRDKTINSLYRKAIVRGFDDPSKIQDIFGRSIVVSSLEEGGKHAMESEKREMTLWHSKKDREIEEEIKNNPDAVVDFLKESTRIYEDSPAVLDIIQSYVLKAEERGAKVRIFDYKPNPRFGQKIESSGAGGGGEVRFAKFYIEHTQKGVKRYEEVQVFTPTSEEKTGFYWEERKKEDDTRYAVDRLMDTQGMRSFVELLWPYGIFGEIVRKIYNREVKQQGQKPRP